MKARLMVPAVAVLGFAAGFAARRPPAKEEAVAAAARGNPREARRESVPVPRGAASTVKTPALTSSDTLTDLVGLDDYELYPRLALWLLDAEEHEMAEFWASYRKRPKRDTWVVDLIFSQWTRINPPLAIAAAKGSGHEGIPWWAWAINDPDAAIAAARDAPVEMGGYVLRAIGQFHPDRALKVLEENPRFARWNGIEGVANGIARDDPETALDFLRERGQLHDTRKIEEWARDDPHAAFEWLLKNPDRSYNRQDEAFITALERENPAVLAELAATLPSGAMKRKFEAAMFRNLVKEDPRAALEMARSSEAPRVAAERFAEIGRTMAADDPQAAKAVFNDLIKSCPDALGRNVLMSYPGGANWSNGAVTGVDDFVRQLVAIDPEGTMSMVISANPDHAAPGQQQLANQGADFVARRWIDRDLDGYTSWLGNQGEGALFDNGAAMVASRLAEQREFESAMEWARQIGNSPSSDNSLGQVLRNWNESDPEAAKSWFEQADLSEGTRRQLKNYLPRQ